MAITFPRSLPSELVIATCRPRILSAVAVAKSPFTFVRQTHVYAGQSFGFDLTAAPSEEAAAGPIRAFLASMNGQEKTCLFGDPMRTTARGAAGTTPGSPTVSGASQTGNSVTCNDATQTNVTGYLLEGDYVQFGTGSSRRLHMVLEDADIDGSGNFTLEIYPSLRESPSDGSAITVSTPQGIFALSANSQSWDEQTIISGFSFGLDEVL